MDETENFEFVVWATITLRGASMVVSAKTKEEALEIAENLPAFEFDGAEMVQWDVTGVSEAS